MDSFLLDSNIIIDSLEKAIPIEKEIKLSRNLALSVISYYEVKYGILKSKKHIDLDEYLLDMQINVLAVGKEEIETSLQVILKLETIGFKIPLPDIFIAGTAITHDFILVTRDKHFSKIKGLRLFED